MLRKVSLLLSFLLLIFIFKENNNTSSSSLEEIINEEALPVWNEEKVESLNYSITIKKESKNKKIIIPTHIIDSILHYKEIDAIEKININLIIENNSNNNYQLEKIYVFDNNKKIFVKEIEYEKKDYYISFALNNSFFREYKFEYIIQIELVKK